MYFSKKVLKKATIQMPLGLSTSSRNNYKDNIYLASFIIIRDR